MEALLQAESRRYQNVFNILQLKTPTQPAEEIQFRLYHIEQDEIVARTTNLLPLNASVEGKKTQFLTNLLEEVQLITLIAEPRHVVGIKEEIVVLSD